MSFFDVLMRFGWPIVGLVVTGLVMHLVRSAFSASRARALPAAHAHRLVHSVGALILGVPALLGCAKLAVYLFRIGETFAAVGVSFFALLGLLLIAEYVFARHELFKGGIHYNGLLTCRRSLRWTDVLKVSYSRRAKWFRLETRNGEVVRIAAELRGLPHFAAAVLAQVAPEAIDDATRQILEATAAGTLPEIWQ